MNLINQVKNIQDWIIDRTNNFTIAVQNKLDQIEKQIEIEKLKELSQ